MKLRTGLALAVVLTTASLFYAISVKTGAQVSTTPDTASVEAPVGDDPAIDPRRPSEVDRVTGTMLAPDGTVVEDDVLNSAEAKQARLLSLWAIENAAEYAELNPPVLPPPDPNVFVFDMSQPELSTALLRAKETDAEREDRELGSLAITDPAAYVEELKRRGLYPESMTTDDSQVAP